jgi:FAD/FMN-containing dehydrogenase
LTLARRGFYHGSMSPKPPPASSPLSTPSPSPAQIARELSEILPVERVRSDADSLATYGRDWTKQYEPRPSAIAFPTAAVEAQKLVRWARARKIGLVPSGGRTGLSGGAVAMAGEVVVSFERMNKILSFNDVDRAVACEAGVVTEDLQRYARDRGYFYPVDFAARGSSQIGGNIATNAGGVKVLRYGSTREWVAGLKVVDGRGELLELNRGLVKNATGFDLRHLMIGSEGCLGLIVEATLRLTTAPKDVFAMLLAVPDLAGIMEAFRAFRDGLPITAFEFFSKEALELVLAQGRLQKPFDATAANYVLVEIERIDEGVEPRALEIFESCVENGWVVDGVVSQNEAQLRGFWALREDISEACSHHTPYKNDISTTIANVPAFLREADALLKSSYPDWRVIWFGHIGDGNLHINILRPPSLPLADFVEKCARASELLFATVEKFGGSISAEHGVGLLKKAFLRHTRSDAEMTAMKALKAVFDPDGILNPGKIFD